MSQSAVPEGYHTVTPYFFVKGVAKLIDFLEAAFDAEVTNRTAGPNDTVMHAQVRVGTSMLMMGEHPGEFESQPLMLYVYIEDMDATYKRALDAGGTSFREPRDEFYGDRVGAVVDPVGNTWWIATRKNDLSDEEVQRLAREHRGT